MDRIAKSATALAVLALLLVPAAPAAGQEHAPEAGDFSVNLALFTDEGGTAFGLWRMMADRINLGLVVDYVYGSIEDVPTGSQIGIRGKAVDWRLTVSPTVKWYLYRDAPVMPFLRGRAGVGWEKSRLVLNGQRQQADAEDLLRLSLSIGADWFPVERVSIGGHTGLTLLRTVTDRETTSARVERTVVNGGTFRSGLEIHLYF